MLQLLNATHPKQDEVISFLTDHEMLVTSLASLAAAGITNIRLIQSLPEANKQLQKTHQKLEEAQAQLIADLEEELQTAHDIQMRLMPTETPHVVGVDIAGRCIITANHVGGDFFQYFRQNGRLAVCIADVTGHAMDAAIPVVMFSGVLRTEMRYGHSLESLFALLNRNLCETLDRRTFICFAMGDLDLSSSIFRLCNAGVCPYPYHYRTSDGEVVELQAEGYPLGVREQSEYPVTETQSDGIIEADNEAGEQFGFDQTAETIRQTCEEGEGRWY